MILIYCRTSVPSEAERLAASASGGKVHWRNGRHWHGEIETADMVVTDNKEIRAGYSKAGVTVRKVETLARKGRNLKGDGDDVE